jgi:hypothetical protein
MRLFFAGIGALSLAAALPAAAQQPLPIDAAKLAPHRDSMVVLVNGQPRGASVWELRKTGDTLVVHELTAIGTVMRQETTVDLDRHGEVRRVSQSGVVRDVQGSIEIRYAAGRVTGQVRAVTPEGPKQFTVDTTVPPGTVDDNALQALLPSLPWAEGAEWSFLMYSAGANSLTEMVLRVVGVETAMVPAGAFDAYRVYLSGGEADVSFLILKRAPHTVLKVEMTGAPLKFELVSGGGL